MDSKKKTILGVAGAIAVVLGGYFGYQHFVYVSTDNAQIGAHVTMLSSRVAGTVQKVFVNENEKVKAGQVLAQIDTSDYANASDVALEARLAEASTNFTRAEELFHQQAISRERFDAAQATFKETSAKLKAAKAQMDQASLNVNYTKILAPTDGVIARKSIEVGQFVPVGQPLFGFVQSDERWVTANLKETELEGVKPGRPAVIDVDAISGRTYHGEVESIGPSTGAVFSLLPPDNATGNFTKVVQRVPVRIKLANLSSDDMDLLQAGLSAVVSIRIR
jgi:membrane fusion protein (multidrug efflux system)